MRIDLQELFDDKVALLALFKLRLGQVLIQPIPKPLEFCYSAFQFSFPQPTVVINPLLQTRSQWNYQRDLPRKATKGLLCYAR